MSFIINFENSTDKGSFETANFSYTDKLNLTNEAVINIPGSNLKARQVVTNGSSFEIKRNGVIELSGSVIGVTYLDGGGISARCKGFEFEASKKRVTKTIYQNTASATIFTAQINAFNSSYLGTIETGINLDFRIDTGSSYSNIFSNLRKKSDQDLEFDYTNKLINIRDHKGSSSSVLTLNDYIDISNLGFDSIEPIGNVITVYGKGDGDNQIISESTSGRNTSSITTFGEIEKPIRDPTIMSVSEANRLADILATKYGSELKVYTFSVNNPSQDLVSGDVIIISAPEKGILGEEVRIVGIKRGMRNGNEFLELEVTNKEYSELLKSSDKLIGDIQRNALDNQTYMQGTTNTLTFTGQINATSAAPLRIVGNLTEDFIEDEAGNIRVNSFTVDYDIDPFRSSVGTATASTDPGLDVNGTAGDSSIESDQGSDSASTTLSVGWNNNELAEGVSGSFTYLDIAVIVEAGFSTSSDIKLILEIDEFSGVKKEYFIKGGTAAGTVLINDVLRLPVFSSTTSTIYLDVYTDFSNFYDLDMSITGVLDLHNHDSGSYDTDSHGHTVSVGDNVSDESSLNATGVTIYVDFWNGSAWINKHSLTSSSTLARDVDISDGGTYPDVAGYWRTRIFTNNTSADLVNGIMKVKHSMDA